MSISYAIINGKRINLDNEDVDNLIKKHGQNPFYTRSTINYGDSVYIVYAPGFKETTYDENSADWVNEDIDNMSCVRTREFALQIHLREMLNRKLMHYAIEHGEYVPPTFNSEGYVVGYDEDYGEFKVIFDSGSNGCVMFESHGCAEDAIREVVEPFVKEHPELDYTIEF